MSSNRMSLANLVSRIDWVMIENKWGGSASYLKPDTFRVALESKNAKETDAIRMVVTLGIDIMTKLGWTYGNRISFFHHPDDLCAFRAVSDPRNGYKISRVKNSPVGRLQVRWPHIQLGMKRMKSKEVENVIHGESLLFIVTE